jgi:hypothetical protein
MLVNAQYNKREKIREEILVYGAQVLCTMKSGISRILSHSAVG